MLVFDLDWGTYCGHMSFIVMLVLLAPTNMLNLFQKTSNIHSYNTRSSTSGKFFVKSSRLEIQNNFFSRLGVKPWNKTPLYITDLPKRTFKRVLLKLLFDILEKDDDYIQIPMIIQNVGT